MYCSGPLHERLRSVLLVFCAVLYWLDVNTDLVAHRTSGSREILIRTSSWLFATASRLHGLDSWKHVSSECLHSYRPQGPLADEIYRFLFAALYTANWGDASIYSQNTALGLGSYQVTRKLDAYITR